MAKKKSETSNLPALANADWEKALVEHAKDEQATLSGVGGTPYISTRGAKFTFNGETQQSPISVIILESARENAYYDKPFNPEQPSNPLCFAVGKDDKTLAPPATLATKQHETCEGCPQNEFGSADRGRGKACRNSMRLAVLPAASIEPKDLAEVEPALLRLPPTALKGWKQYVVALQGTMKKPPLGVVTEVSLASDEKTMLKFGFKPVGALGPAQGAVVLQKRSAVQNDLLREMQTGVIEVAAKGKSKKKFDARRGK